jgi:hypothetical protein
LRRRTRSLRSSRRSFANSGRYKKLKNALLNQKSAINSLEAGLEASSDRFRAPSPERRHPLDLSLRFFNSNTHPKIIGSSLKRIKLSANHNLARVSSIQLCR